MRDHTDAKACNPVLLLRHLAAEMPPLSGVSVSSDETLRGPNGEKVSLRQFVGRPILAYNYAQW